MRLVAFGCSHTYGEGILEEDVMCVRNPKNGKIIKYNHELIKNPKPSKASWAQVMANNLNVELLNLAIPGGSINQVMSQMLKHEWKEDDVAIILWPNIDRYTILNEDVANWEYDKPTQNNHTFIHPNITPHGPKDIQINFYKIFDDFNLQLLNFMLLDHAYSLLQSKNIKYICRHVSEIRGNGNNSQKTILNNYKFSREIKKNGIKTGFFNSASIYGGYRKNLGADLSHMNEFIHEKFGEIMLQDYKRKYLNDSQNN